MQIAGYLLVILFIGVAQSCDNTIIDPYNPNHAISIDYVGNAPGSNAKFTLAFSNSLPGVVYPNSKADAVIDTHSFALMDPTTYGVKPAHITFGTIYGGATKSVDFLIPKARTGANKCLELAFYYNVQNGTEYFFMGSISLETSSKKRSESVAEENQMVARGTTCTDTILFPEYVDWNQDSYAAAATQSFHVRVTGLAVTNLAISVVDPTGNIFVAYSGARSWAGTTNANTTKTAYPSFSACSPGVTYSMKLTATYTCGGVARNTIGWKDLICL